MDLINFTNKKDEYEEVISFLAVVGEDYYPTLSSRGSLNQYIDPILKDGNIIYLKEKDKIIGMITYFYYYANRGAAYVDTISILKEYRGKKLGKLLMDKCLEDFKLRGIDKVRVRTWSTNEASKALYLKSGFKVYDVVKDDRGKGVDSIYFEKNMI